ncbi:MAG: ABC transporter substrate-binding protein [Actinomycetota bacterium]
MKILKLILFLIFSLFVLLNFSCQRVQGSNNTSKITIADTTGDWGFPSPYGMYSRGPGYIRMSLIFDTLVWKDIGGNFIPGLANNWEYSNSNNSYIFSLRKDVFWHDGHEFDAGDVIFTFDYIKEHPWIWVNSDFIKKVEKISNYKVKIYLAEKYAPFLPNIAGTLPIMPEHIWSNVADPGKFTAKEALIGTGPYQLLDYNKGQSTYLFEANKDYYNGKPVYAKIVFVKNSAESIPAALEAGNIDAGPIPVDSVSSLKENFNIKQEPPAWAAKLIFNHEKNALLTSKEFRKAIAYGINRKNLVDISQRGFAIEGNPGLLPPTNEYWHNPGVSQYSYDTGKATEIIEDMGFQLNQEGFYFKEEEELSLNLAVTQDFARDGEIIKNDLEKLGLKINLYSYEPKTLDNMVKAWDFDLAISGHGGLGGDPEILNKVIIGEGFNSVRFFENEKLVTLLQDQVQEMDQEERKEIVLKIQEIYAEELPSLTLYYPKWYWAHNDRVEIEYTGRGVALGIPIPLNKILFINRK